MAIADYEPNLERWLKYRSFMTTEYDNGNYYVLNLSSNTFHEVKRVVKKESYFSNTSDAERFFMLYENELGELNIYCIDEDNKNYRLFKVERTWSGQRKKHFMSKYFDCVMPDSLAEIMRT